MLVAGVDYKCDVCDQNHTKNEQDSASRSDNEFKSTATPVCFVVSEGKPQRWSVRGKSIARSEFSSNDKHA